MRRFLSAVFICSVAIVHAEVAGYVVKADSGTLYLDLGSASGASIGQNFVVFTEGEELRHPVTGASLGRIERQVAKGHIEQIMDKYCVARLDEAGPGPKAPAVAPGQKIRLLSTFAQTAAPAQPLAPMAPAAQAPLPASAAPSPGAVIPAPASAVSQLSAFWRSPAMDMEAVDIAIGDVLGDGKREILLADADHVYAYPQAGDWKPVCRYENPGTGSKILSLEAADLDKNGRAEVFATTFNGVFERVETAVLECKGNAFEKLATLPFMVRAFQDASGEPKLAVQQLIDDKTFPFGNIYYLEYRDGKYAAGARIQAKRLEWAYGFALAKDSMAGDPFPIFVTQNNSLRAQFNKKAWVSEESYAQTASRLAWQGRDRPMMFYPRLLTIQKNGFLDGLFIVENVPSYGVLGGAFGYFSDARLHFLRWDGLSLKREWATDKLGGYAADAAMARSPDGRTEIWLAVVGSGGRTSVLKLQP